MTDEFTFKADHVVIAKSQDRLLEFHDGDWYHITDNHSSEVEMGQVLFGLIRYLKPFIAIETGTCWGYSTLYMSQALGENLKGRLISCELDSEKFAKAKEHCGIGPHELRNCSSLDLPELSLADFIFSDSDFADRVKEYDMAKSGCTYVVHDVRLVPQLAQFVKDRGGMVFDKGRGFGIIQKG